MNGFKVALMATTVAAVIAMAGSSAYAADLAKPGVVISPAPAAADGLYLSVFAGASFASDPSGAYTTYNIDIPTDTGFVLGGAVGTHLSKDVRAELEVSYVSNGVKSFNFVDGPDTAEGSFNTLYILGNVWYDFDLGGPLTPYVGGGAGVAVLLPNLTNVFGQGDAYNYTSSSSSVAPAAQLGAGIKYQISDNLALDVGYRAKMLFNATIPGGGTEPAADLTRVFNVDQTVQAGLTFSF